MCELASRNIGDWNADVIFHILPPKIAPSILKRKILPTSQLDKLIWAHENNGIFSVKSAYNKIFDEK